MLGKPKYTYKDKVEFKWPRSINLIGYIQVVDSFGTFEQQEEPSYDIYVDANNTLYKHVKESEVIRKIENNDFEIITVSSKEQFEKPATFFSNKWGVPLEAYLESMEDSLTSKSGVPAWFYIERDGEVIAGLGIIENDFHKHKDLAPNICAVYVKHEYERMGIAKALLNKACIHLKNHNIDDVYLITTHTEFYEHCGFDYYGEIEEDSGDLIRCYHRKCE